MSNKFESNKKYFTISIYSFLVIISALLFYKFISNWETTTTYIKNSFKVLSPFLMAFLISYLLNPLVRIIENKIMLKIKIKKFVINKTIGRILSILLSYVISIGFIILTLTYVLPQVIKSIGDLIDKFPILYESTYPKIIDFINNIYNKYPTLDSNMFKNSINNYLPNLFIEFKALMTNIIPLLYSISVSLVTGIINLLLALVISFYLLADKENLLSKCKKIIYAFLPEKTADRSIELFRDSHKIFSGFVIGKTIDSLIIGVMCFGILLLTKIPFALLISVIVGITNMIPYFGPFIGAVPGILIVLIVDPVKAIWFAIIIFLLQQFDGLVLGPKILGESTGLKPIWVIFSITVGGATFGVLGMFLGVPTFAVISFLFDKAVYKKLKNKNITSIK